MLGCDIPDEALFETHPDYETYKKKYKNDRDKAKIIDEIKNEGKKKLEKEVAAFEADHHTPNQPSDPFQDPAISEEEHLDAQLSEEE